MGLEWAGDPRPRPTGRQTPRTQIPGMIQHRAPFKGSNIRGQAFPAYVDYGRLPTEWRERLRQIDEVIGITYVVYSYGTPIAWENVGGEVVVPDTRYSPTTSNHQRIARQGFINVDVEVLHG